MTITIVRVEHFQVPGVKLSAHSTLTGAQSRAAELVEMMWSDDGRRAAPRRPWQEKLATLQDAHGAQYCYVEIEAVRLED
jgi:hypothetical protein